MSFLEKPIYSLLKDEPFYANFLLGSSVTTNDPKVQRAAVRYFRGNIDFVFNVEWFSSLTLKSQCSILKHEILHVLLDHVASRSRNTNRKAANYGMDCAINQYISDLPDDCITLKYISELCKKDLKPFESYEYYYEQLKQAVEDYEKDHPEDHDYMDGDGEGLFERESDRASREATLKALLRDKTDKAIKASAGLVPDSLKTVLGSLMAKPTLSWKQQLRNLVGSARSIKNKPTRLKLHRRYDLDQAGKKKDKTFVIGIPTDSSGSVSNEDYSSFMTEVMNIVKSSSLAYLIQADCVVQKVDVIKNGKAKKDVLTVRHGAGGTAYQPAIDECVKRKCDVIIYFGDGDSADVPKDPKIPFIWVLVGDQKPPADFGHVIRLNSNK